MARRMMSVMAVAAVVVVVAVVAIAVAFAGPSNGVEPNNVDPDVTEPAKVIGDVIMPTKVSRPGCEETNTCYIPTTITVETGKSVTWVNEDSAFHSVTSGSYDEPTDLFDSGYMDPYDSYTVTFDQVGTFDYFCTLHPWMMGQVVVG